MHRAPSGRVSLDLRAVGWRSVWVPLRSFAEDAAIWVRFMPWDCVMPRREAVGDQGQCAVESSQGLLDYVFHEFLRSNCRSWSSGST